MIQDLISRPVETTGRVFNRRITWKVLASQVKKEVQWSDEAPMTPSCQWHENKTPRPKIERRIHKRLASITTQW